MNPKNIACLPITKFSTIFIATQKLKVRHEIGPAMRFELHF